MDTLLRQFQQHDPKGFGCVSLPIFKECLLAHRTPVPNIDVVAQQFAAHTTDTNGAESGAAALVDYVAFLEFMKVLRRQAMHMSSQVPRSNGRSLSPFQVSPDPSATTPSAAASSPAPTARVDSPPMPSSAQSSRRNDRPSASQSQTQARTPCHSSQLPPSNGSGQDDDALSWVLIQQIFSEIDRNADGFVTFSDLFSGLLRIGAPVQREAIERLFGEADRRKSGRLDVFQFAHVVRSLLPSGAAQQALPGIQDQQHHQQQHQHQQQHRDARKVPSTRTPQQSSKSPSVHRKQLRDHTSSSPIWPRSVQQLLREVADRRHVLLAQLAVMDQYKTGRIRYADACTVFRNVGIVVTVSELQKLVDDIERGGRAASPFRDELSEASGAASAAIAMGIVSYPADTCDYKFFLGILGLDPTLH
eukprot:NODE_1227_length_1628_cov_27.095630_g1092_i0.p1 GENE.NODE_1227_length_1628_cov_27.095630_g1092_i0~~NODE_1227_length_1628_cov_27.095630_g1092_i0.p1  ORF type:complete len:418 (+),score=87.32 NODE_1227_length_1628_cov_27.095630_g1092_i0:273-1526(+)